MRESAAAVGGAAAAAAVTAVATRATWRCAELRGVAALRAVGTVAHALRRWQGMAREADRKGCIPWCIWMAGLTRKLRVCDRTFDCAIADIACDSKRQRDVGGTPAVRRNENWSTCVRYVVLFSLLHKLASKTSSCSTCTHWRATPALRGSLSQL
jgi:hypothetical protein